MNREAESILQSLRSVSQQRAAREQNPLFGERTQRIKVYQQARLQHTYADMLANPKYAKAAQFFLDELYGPYDYSRRDAQFAKVVPALIRLFPAELTHTVKALGELHALAESLDSAMGLAVDGACVDSSAYARAWRQVGRRPDREQQIRLLYEVGMAMDVYTTKPLLRHSLRLMRVPARAAGLGELQRFLETGFDTFRAMGGAAYFMDSIVQREGEMVDVLFRSEADTSKVLVDRTV